MLSYTFTPGVLKATETWTLHPDSLLIESKSGNTHLHFKDLLRVRISFAAPTEYSPHVDFCELTTPTASVRIKSASWQGAGDIVDQQEAYHTFVKALHEALVPFADRITFEMGVGWLAYTLVVVFAVFCYVSAGVLTVGALYMGKYRVLAAVPALILGGLLFQKFYAPGFKPQRYEPGGLYGSGVSKNLP